MLLRITEEALFDGIAPELRKELTHNMVGTPVTLNFNQRIGQVSKVNKPMFGDTEIQLDIRGHIEASQVGFEPAYTVGKHGELKLMEVSLVTYPDYA